MYLKDKWKIWKFNVTNTCPRKVEVQSQRPFRFPRNPRSYPIDVYLAFISSHRRFELLNARLFYIPFHSMSHWSTHRLILLLHKYYDAYEDDIKGSAARALDDGYFRLTVVFRFLALVIGPSPVRFLRGPNCPVLLLLFSFLPCDPIQASSPHRRDHDSPGWKNRWLIPFLYSATSFSDCRVHVSRIVHS